MGRDSGGIWFRFATPVVFQMQPVDTLEELKAVMLRNMGVAGGTGLVRRVAYLLLNIFPPNQFKFRIFWVDGDVHVRGMFDLHHRYGPREVMELLTEMQTVDADVGGPSSSAGGPADVIPCSPIHCTPPGAAMQLEMNSNEGSDEDFVGDTDDSTESLDALARIPDLSSVSSHFHTLHLDDMREEPMEGFGGGGDDYDVAGGEEFKVGHRFSTREAVQMAVKNNCIRRAAEYKVVELDRYKYVCRCKQYGAGCPWSIRVALRKNLGYWECGGLVDHMIVWHRRCPLTMRNLTVD
ncbi:hypothetical protein PIB30_040141 [Stylosanthes scabra]|uniref:Transposase MuDR plant domain-containing protein n=1 Tax=Stylosanthes scabra TaxID=79078 RepID=A0ABU6UDU1_9FABA|nr:hypothetical protein [Stylosanthes scabra]